MSRPAPRLLHLCEVAEASRTPLGTVRDWVARELLPHTRPGRRVLVRRADLAKFLGVLETDLELGIVSDLTRSEVPIRETA